MTPKEQALKDIEGRIESIQQLSIECIEHIYLAAYNEAIEAAAKLVDKDTRSDQAGYKFGPAIEIRKLKK